MLPQAKHPSASNSSLPGPSGSAGMPFLISRPTAPGQGKENQRKQPQTASLSAGTNLRFDAFPRKTSCPGSRYSNRMR